MEVSDQPHTQAALLPGNKPPVPPEQEVGWDPEPIWTFWREKSLPPARIWTSDGRLVTNYTDYTISTPTFATYKLT
jgi:hypothetical protein